MSEQTQNMRKKGQGVTRVRSCELVGEQENKRKTSNESQEHEQVDQIRPGVPGGTQMNRSIAARFFVGALEVKKNYDIAICMIWPHPHWISFKTIKF